MSLRECFGEHLSARWGRKRWSVTLSLCEKRKRRRKYRVLPARVRCRRWMQIIGGNILRARQPLGKGIDIDHRKRPEVRFLFYDVVEGGDSLGYIPSIGVFRAFWRNRDPGS